MRKLGQALLFMIVSAICFIVFVNTTYWVLLFASITAVGRAFLSRASKEKRVKYADDDIPRSFILCVEDGSKHTPPRKRRKSGKNRPENTTIWKEVHHAQNER